MDVPTAFFAREEEKPKFAFSEDGWRQTGSPTCFSPYPRFALREREKLLQQISHVQAKGHANTAVCIFPTLQISGGQEVWDEDWGSCSRPLHLAVRRSEDGSINDLITGMRKVSSKTSRMISSNVRRLNYKMKLDVCNGKAPERAIIISGAEKSSFVLRATNDVPPDR